MLCGLIAVPHVFGVNELPSLHVCAFSTFPLSRCGTYAKPLLLDAYPHALCHVCLLHLTHSVVFFGLDFQGLLDVSAEVARLRAEAGKERINLVIVGMSGFGRCILVLLSRVV